MKQQIDPIAQAMQILQFVTQRRGQQVDINQGQQRLDLYQEGMQMDRQRGRQQNRQFQQGMNWDRERALMQDRQFMSGLASERERALMQQKQVEDAQTRDMLKLAYDNTASQQKLGAEELHRKQMLEKIQQQTQAGNMQDLRAMLGDLQNEAMLSQNDPVRLQQIQYEAEQIRQRLREFYQLQPMPQAPVDPKTAQLNAQF